MSTNGGISCPLSPIASIEIAWTWLISGISFLIWRSFIFVIGLAALYLALPKEACMRFTLLRKILLGVVLVFGGFYLATILFLKANEENMIFFPTRDLVATPASIDLSFRDIAIIDGKGPQLHGWLIGGSRDSGATVLFFHGNYGNISHNFGAIRYWQPRCRQLVMFDYRGYGLSEGEINAAAFMADSERMLLYVRNTLAVDLAKIIVHGQSLGGHAALWIATNYRPGGVLLESTFTSIPDVAAEIYPILPIRWIMSVDFDNRTLMQSNASPLVLAHSRNDQLIPVSHSEELFALAAEPRLLLTPEEGRHSAVLNDSLGSLIDAFFGRGTIGH
jgi:fermentation-respiration switch protein FrsA (DUF1100 family)